MITIWGFSFVAVDIAVEFMPPVSFALYRFLIASLTFVIIDVVLFIRKRRNNNKESKNREIFSRNDWILLFIASITGVSVFFFSQYSAIAIIGPSLPALFVGLLAPLIIAILALIFFKEKLNTLKILGFVIATIGGFLLITGGSIKTLAPTAPNFLGYLFALITPVLWGVYSTTTKHLNKSNSSMTMLKYIGYLGMVELLFFVLISNEIQIFLTNLLNPIILLCALYTGILCYIVGYYIWQNSQTKLKSSKVASFLYVEPFITLLFSFLLQRSETIVFWNILGGIIVLVAVLIINYK
ncbi:MAG: DMT family transporter [Promethearchaeota archaeon]|jgi:drug/metabolite transporter (DMT)-like permease